MTISQAAKGIVGTGGGTYRIGFINDTGNDDETEFSAYNSNELSELYSCFCRENSYMCSTVTYVENCAW